MSLYFFKYLKKISVTDPDSYLFSCIYIEYCLQNYCILLRFIGDWAPYVLRLRGPSACALPPMSAHGDVCALNSRNTFVSIQTTSLYTKKNKPYQTIFFLYKIFYSRLKNKCTEGGL